MDAVLNKLGMKVWGHVFGNGVVPVLTPEPFIGRVEGSRGELKDGELFTAYLVDWSRLTVVQKYKILAHLKSRFSATPEESLAQIMSVGLPMRAEMISSVAISLHMF